jgi:hypothetical protein
MLNDSRELQNFLTINIEDELLKNSYGIETAIDTLVINSFKDIKFKINQK